MAGDDGAPDEGLFGAPSLPHKIGRFEIIGALPGRRAEPRYRARDPHREHEVALRLFHAHADADAALREAHRLIELSHPNVVPAYGAGTIDGHVYVESAHVDGVSLDQWLTGAPTKQAVVELFCDVGRGLAAAHAAGIVHGDIRPDAIVVSSSGVGLLDGFALVGTRRPRSSAAVDSSAEHRFLESSALDPVSIVGGLLATPAYMAPERHRGHAADERSDQFSFCVALWEAVHGQRPFAGTTLGQVADAILSGEPVAPPAGSVPAGVTEAIGRGLAKDASDRFRSMDALVDAISPRRRRRGPILVAVLVAACMAALVYALAISDVL